MAFIAFEGLDGSGKSTLIEGLRQELTSQGLAVRVTREPGGTPLGEDVRGLLLRVKGDSPTPRAELLLYLADRAHNVDTVIRPALREKQWVLSDRYAASSVAFQAGGRSISETDVEKLNLFATDGEVPDLYVLLDISVDECEKRMRHREKDRFEQEKRDFHQRVRDAYLKLAKKDSGRWLVLSADQAPDKVLQELLSQLRKRQWLK